MILPAKLNGSKEDEQDEEEDDDDVRKEYETDSNFYSSISGRRKDAHRELRANLITSNFWI